MATWYGAQMAKLGLAEGEWNRERFAASIESHLASPVSAELRAHQTEALQGILGQLRTPEASPTSITVIPTAGGKTRVFLHLVGALSRGRQSPRTIMLVPTRELIGQTWREMRRRFPDVDLGYFSSSHILDEEGVPVPKRMSSTMLMTYTRFMRMVASGRLTPDDVDFLVMDEAHRALSDLRKDVVSQFKDKVFLAAFSATPAFDEGKSLEALLGQENVTLVISAQRLRDEGIIAPVINLVLGINISGDMPDEQTERVLLRRKALVDSSLDFLETHVDDEVGLALRDKICLFYGSDVAHARMFVREYNQRFATSGKEAILVTGEDSPAHLREAVRGVHEGVVGAFGNAQVLVEGFDLPKIGLAINSPTESLVKQLQQSGRAQRIDPDLPAFDPRQTAFVLDCYYRINGEILGTPCFYFDAARDPSVAKLVEMAAVQVTDIDLADYVEREEFTPVEVSEEESSVGNESPAETETDLADVAVSVDGEALPPEVDVQVTVEVRAAPVEEVQEEEVEVSPRRAAGPSDFTVTSALESVVRFMRERDEGIYERKTDEWLGLGEVVAAARTSLNNVGLRRIWDLAESTDSYDEPIVVDGVSLRFSKRTSGERRKRHVCLHQDDLLALCRVAGITSPDIPSLGQGELFKVALKTALEISSVDPKFEEVFDRVSEILSDEDESVREPLGLRGGWRRASNGMLLLAVHESSIPGIRKMLGGRLPRVRKGDEWMFKIDVVRALDLSEKNLGFTTLWESLIADAEAGKHDKERLGFRFEKVFGGTQTFYAIHKDGLEWLARQCGRALDGKRLKTDEWKSGTELVKNHEFPKSRYAEVTALFDGWKVRIERGETTCLGRDPIRVELRTSVSKTVVCLHVDEIERLRSHMGIVPLSSLPEKSAEWLSMTEIMKEAGLSKDRGFPELWQSIADDHETHGKATLDGRVLKLGLFRANKKMRLCLHVSEIQGIRDHYGLGPLKASVRVAGDDDLSQMKAASELGTNRESRNFQGLWKLLKAASENGRAIVNGESVNFGETRRGTIVECTLHRSSLDWYRRALAEGLGLGGKLKTSEWLTIDEAAKRCRTSPLNLGYRKILNDAILKVGSKEENPIQIDRRRSGSRECWCIHIDSIDTLSKLIRQSPDRPESVSSAIPSA